MDPLHELDSDYDGESFINNLTQEDYSESLSDKTLDELSNGTAHHDSESLLSESVQENYNESLWDNTLDECANNTSHHDSSDNSTNESLCQNLVYVDSSSKLSTISDADHNEIINIQVK